MLKLREYIDLIVPRGGARLINNAVMNSTVPVLQTGTGNCHVYVDKSADYAMAEAIVINAKTQRTGVCNAAETLLVQEDWAEEHLKSLLKALTDKNVELHGDNAHQGMIPARGRLGGRISPPRHGRRPRRQGRRRHDAGTKHTGASSRPTGDADYFLRNVAAVDGTPPRASRTASVPAPSSASRRRLRPRPSRYNSYKYPAGTGQITSRKGISMGRQHRQRQHGAGHNRSCGLGGDISS
ncbi:MAG: hypothetical protein ACLUEK_16550 [Oscillospiraceae bacterium]